MKILIAIDGSRPAHEAVKHVVALAKSGLKLEVVIANVQEPATFYELLFAKDMELIAQACAQAGLDTLRSAASLLEAANISFEREVAKGDAAGTLLDIAERFQCNMVVMGTRGESAMRVAALGSVAQEVLYASTIPVTLVKYEPEEEEG